MDLYKGLKHLYPDARPMADYVLRDDGDGPYIAAWNLASPQPTEAQLAAAIVAADAAEATRQTEAAALRAQVLTIAQGAVGTRVDLLTAQQVRALVAILLWKNGALNAAGVVRPLGEWV